MQDYLDVKITKTAEHNAIVGKLPTALQTLFQKLRIFSEQYPQFNLQVQVKGDDSKVQQCYQNYSQQLMFNPWWTRSVSMHRNKPVLKPSSILDRSKTIKKRSKTTKIVVAEEGEEIAEKSGEESNQDDQMEEERAPTALLGQFEKFPLYIEFSLKPAASIFSSSLIQSYNKFSLSQVLD